MLWMIAVILIMLWMLALGIDLMLGPFIHILYAAAVYLLVVSLSREVMIHRKSRPVSRRRGLKPDGKRMPGENDPDTERIESSIILVTEKE
jgi:hypothetical protein